MKYLSSVLNVMLSPMARAKALRTDDRAQTMILTAVMVFMLMIFTISILNTSTGIYNRMRAQNAVDAAADAYAIWQARGSNVAQHINDIHWGLNIAYFTAVTIGCAVRVGCVFLKAIPYVGPALEAVCCGATSALVTAAEIAQAATQVAAHLFQEVINVLFPLIGVMRAQQVAEANGADPVLEVAADLIDDLLGLFGVNLAIGDLLGAIGNVPIIGGITGAFYAFPLNPSPDDLLSLNLQQKSDNMIPPWYMPEELVDVCKNLPCSIPMYCASGSVEDSNEASAIPDLIPDVGTDCGWEDTYYYGYPGYNTWIAGKRAVNIIGGYEKLPWLNPRRGISMDGVNVFVHSTHTVSAANQFMNNARLAVASSQPWGHSDPERQPVIEQSITKSDFRWMQAHLISVHYGWSEGEDGKTAENFMIWH